MHRELSEAALLALRTVKGKRSRVVVDHILKHGSITTDDLKVKYGYNHPPRAIRDVRDQGIPLKKTTVRGKDGKPMAEYCFGDLETITPGNRGGRAGFPKAFKKNLIAEYGSRCGLCDTLFEPRYLQIDHRIPYAVAGGVVSASLDVKDFMLVCGSCNRAKSWSCEHCPNSTAAKNPQSCTTCYWASPLEYVHVAMKAIRRLDLTWTGNEVSDFDAAKAKAGPLEGAMPKFVKDALRRAVQGDGGSTESQPRQQNKNPP